jgi:Ca2+-binding RTX toxin-like protein
MARTFRGTAGNDTVTGALNDQDLFTGFGQGFDNLTGGNRNDTFNLTVDEFRDRIDGGQGVDTVNYSGADRGLLIDLQFGVTVAQFLGEARPAPGGNGWISGYEEKIVTELHNIENVVGSQYNDTIVGSNGNNVIEGGGGADYINGAGGNDTVSYASSSEGVTIDLAPQDLGFEGRGKGGDAQGDRFVSIENVIGSRHDDVIIGTRGDNVLTGGNGSDTFIFRGGVGHDTITDFAANGRDHDFIQFEHYFRNFDELREHAENRGNDVVITIDEHNSITLEGVHLNQLHENDFYFI